MKEMWDKRYGNTEYAYGEEPNAFFKKTLDKLDLKGSISVSYTHLTLPTIYSV